MGDRVHPNAPADDDSAVLVSIRTGTNTSSECVGTLHLSLCTRLCEVRHQLVSLALVAKKSRKGAAAVQEALVKVNKAGKKYPPAPQPPPLTGEQKEKLAKIRLHAFDFCSPFQFVRCGGVRAIPEEQEEELTITDVFPLLPNTGIDFPNPGFLLPKEVEIVGVNAAAAQGSDGGSDDSDAASPARKRRRLPTPHEGGRGRYHVAAAALYVRQQNSDHSEKVVMERLLMQNNVFGRLQTPQQLGALISKHNANTRDFLGRSILQECAQEGNYYVVAFLLGLSFVKVEAKDWRGQTALHLAVDRGHLEVVSLLLDAGADVLAQDSCGRTPLHLALERRADVLAARLCARLHAGQVTHAQLEGFTDLHGRDPMALFALLSPQFSELCRAGQLPGLRALWNHYLFDRRKVLERGMNGASCLHEAVESLHLAVVQFLMEEVGMDAALHKCEDANRRTPLHVACHRGHVGMAQYLVGYFDANEVDVNLRTALHVALLKKRTDVAVFLLSEVPGLRVNGLDINDHTPLHIAAAHNMVQCCQLLITHHAANPGLTCTTKSFACLRQPAVPLNALTRAERVAFRKRHLEKERRWRLASWELRRYDAAAGAFAKRGDFPSDRAWAKAKLKALHPRPVEEGGPNPDLIKKPKGGPMLIWNTAQNHAPNARFASLKLHPTVFWKHQGKPDTRLPSSGLFWLRHSKATLQPKPPVVELVLRRKPGASTGLEVDRNMVVEHVDEGSPAWRCGLGEYVGYQVTAVLQELIVSKEGTSGIGIRCDGNIVDLVHPGGAADQAGLRPGMRVLAVNQREEQEISRIPCCDGAVQAAIDAAPPQAPFSITVSIAFTTPQIFDEVVGHEIGLRLERPLRQSYRSDPAAAAPFAHHYDNPDVETPDRHGYTLKEGWSTSPSALWAAVASHGQYRQVVELLLAHGAFQASNLPPPAAAKIVAKLIADKHLDLAGSIVKLMGDDKGGLLHKYIELGAHDVVRWLVEHECDINERDLDSGHTPLAVAARKGDSRIVMFLLEQGADAGGGGGDHDPLYQAVKEGRDVVPALLSHLRSRVNAPVGTAEHYTPLQVAAMQGDLKYVKALVGIGADLNVLSAGEKNCLWLALEAAPAAAAALPPAGRKDRTVALHPQQHREADYEAVAAFLCAKGVDVSGARGGAHPADYLDLAASKGLWNVVGGLLELLRQALPAGQLERTPPFAWAPIEHRHDRTRRGDGEDDDDDDEEADAAQDAQQAHLRDVLAKENPSVALRRDIYVYAAKAGKDAVAAELLLEWGLAPSPGRDAATLPRNVLDHAFAGGKIDLCLMLLSRGMLPTRRLSNQTNPDIRALFSAVWDLVRPCLEHTVTGRKGHQKRVPPSKPFPTLPVNILTYSPPGGAVAHPRPGVRVQTVWHGGLAPGEITAHNGESVYEVSFDNGAVEQVDARAQDLYLDEGWTLLHALVAGGHVGLLKRLIGYTASHADRTLRFSGASTSTSAGSLLYCAVRHRQDKVVEMLLDEFKAKAVTTYDRSPLLAAVQIGSLSMLQALADTADVNAPGKVFKLPLPASRDGKYHGQVVTPLYLASVLLEAGMVAYLLSCRASPEFGRFVQGEPVQKPLHGCLSVAERAIPGTPAQQQFFNGKKALAAHHAAGKIAAALMKAGANANEVAMHVGQDKKARAHVLNMAARKGFFGLVKEMIAWGATPRAAVQVVLDDTGDHLSVYRKPHVLHYLAAAGDVEGLQACIGSETVRHGQVDLLLPDGVGADGERMFKIYQKGIRGTGTTADQALAAQRPEALAYLLSKGVRLSRVSCWAAPWAVPVMRQYVGRRCAKKNLPVVVGSPSLHESHVASQFRTLCDEVERESSQRVGYTYLHAAVWRGGAVEAALRLIAAWAQVASCNVHGMEEGRGAGLSAPLQDRVLGAVTPLSLAVMGGGSGKVAEALLQHLVAHRQPLEFEDALAPLPWAAFHGNKALVTKLAEQNAGVNAAGQFLYPDAARAGMFWAIRERLPNGTAGHAQRANLAFGRRYTLTHATALFFAAMHGWDDTIAYLHARGANLKDSATTARFKIYPSFASYHSRPHVVLKKKADKAHDDYDDDDDDDARDSDAPRPKFRARMLAQIAKARAALVKQLELPANPDHADDGGDDVVQQRHMEIAQMSLVAAFGSLRRAFKALQEGGPLTQDTMYEGCLAAGVDAASIDVLCPMITEGMTYRDFRGLFEAKTHRPCGHAATNPRVSFHPRDAVHLRPIWGVVAGAPANFSKDKTGPTAAREKCERYIRAAKYVIHNGGVAGLPAAEVTALILAAAHRGLWEVAILLLKEGGREAKAQGEDGQFLVEVDDAAVKAFLPGVAARHPIHVAAKSLDKDIFYLFLKRTKQHDATTLRDPRGYTALHIAILSNNQEVADLLLQLPCADVETPAGGGVRTHHPVRRGKIYAEARDAADGLTALMLAARVNNVGIINQLLAARANINAQDSNGDTPLIHACEMGNIGVVEALVSAGADVGIQNARHFTALMRACVRGHTDVALPLLQYWTRNEHLESPATSVLHCAVQGGCDAVVNLLMTDFDTHTFNVLAKDSHPGSCPNSPLWISWALGRWQAKAKLLQLLQARERDGPVEAPEDERDARIVAHLRKRDKEEYSDEMEDVLVPGWLSHAVQMAARIHVKLTHSTGPKQSFPTDLVYSAVLPSLRDSLRLGCTAPRLRSTKDNPSAARGPKMRLETLCTGDRLERATKEKALKWSLLEWAVRANNAVVVKVVGDHCLPDTCHAIHMASARGNLDIVQILLQLQMSSVSSHDERGRTALMRALENGHEKMALFLMSKTPARKLLRLTPDGKTLLHLCAQSGMENAIAHMIGCLAQLERRLKGDDRLDLHEFLSIPDQHPDLVDYDSQDEGDEERVDEPPTTGFTPFEYALMFGHPEVALRIAYGSTISAGYGTASPSITLNPRFPGPAGFNLPIMAPGVRAMLSEFFNDPSRGFGSGPFTIRGDYVRHPTHSAPDGDGLWPKERKIITFERLSWPDVRAIGIAKLAQTPWVADKLSEILTFEHERAKYASLLSCFDLHGRVFRLNTASLSVLDASSRLIVLQHLASVLIAHRYTTRDHDWTSPTGAVDCSVLGVDAVRRQRGGAKGGGKEQEGSRLAVMADGVAGQISCVQMEYVPDRSQVRVVIDSEGVVHERFTMTDGVIECGSLEDAVEAHFRRKERVAKIEADNLLRDVNGWLRASGHPILQQLAVSVDWRSVDGYRFDAKQDRLRLFEVLASNRGIWSIKQALEDFVLAKEQETPCPSPARGAHHSFPASGTSPFSSIVFRRATYNDGQFYVTEQPTKDAAPKGALVVLYDVKHGVPHFSNLARSLSPLCVHIEFDMLRQLLAQEQVAFRARLNELLPEAKCKLELEGSWRLPPGGALYVYHHLQALLDCLLERLRGMVSHERAPNGKLISAAPPRSSSPAGTSWADLNQVPEVNFATLLSAAVHHHIRSLGVLVSPRRDPTAKFASSSRTVIACIKADAEGVVLPSSVQLANAMYYSVIEIEARRLQDQVQATLIDAQQRLATYLPNTTLAIDWKSFDALEGEARFTAIGVLCHGRGVKVLQPLISGMSVGWDSKLGGFVRKAVKHIVLHCSAGWESHTELDGKGVLHFYAALLRAGSVEGSGGLLTAQQIATEVIIHLEDKELAAEEKLREKLLLAGPAHVDPAAVDAQGGGGGAASKPAATPASVGVDLTLAPAPGPAGPAAPRITDHVDTTHAFPCWCTAQGEHLRAAEAGAAGSFTIQARNILNVKCAKPDGAPPPIEPFAVRITAGHPNGDVMEIPLDIKAPAPHSEYNWRYVVSYTAPEEAQVDYFVHVTLNGIHIAGSPMRLKVRAKRQPVRLVPVDGYVTSAVLKAPMVLQFQGVDEYGNRVSRLRPRVQRGEQVTVKAAGSVRRILQQCDMVWHAGLERFCGEQVAVTRVMHHDKLVAVAWKDEAKKRLYRATLPQRCIEGHGAVLTASCTADRDMVLGRVVDGHDGTCTVRVVPLEEDETDVTVALTDPDGGEPLTCVHEFNVVPRRLALEHVRAHALLPWEKELRAMQKNRWEKEGWATWKKDPHRRYDHQRVAFLLPVPPQKELPQKPYGKRKTVAYDGEGWASTLRGRGVHDVPRATFKEWAEFRKEVIVDNEGHQVPSWWMREPHRHRVGLLHKQAVRLPPSQELALLRVAVQPDEIAASLLRQFAQFAALPAAPRDATRQQRVARGRAVYKMTPREADARLQNLVEMNGGGKGTITNIALPLRASRYVGSEEQELARRRLAEKVYAALLSVTRV
eukprot:TRINITY_DN2650_c0_g1_i1.p1 TRINITY_DN2650_c0_g1~~TRINITY_DN2650_c0_g1_i1.p1  ORF type:complete len:4276 (+),score=1824.49 TRINITY_DN2650_c0_g1_i1:119-12946(+)